MRGNVTVFEGMASYFDKQISKVVLGQTGTTDVGQHVGTANAHEKVREDIEASDAAQLSATLNRDLVRPLVDLNLGPVSYTHLHPKNPRPTMLTNLLIAIGVVVVVAFIFSPAG